ncbi:hypothetical protein ES319_1Z212600v1 [Gossypium barbadense]|uniref:Uncharacterized protein n=2 Tax=Gossypium TaxID=3633 RepID=A0A5J5ND81_GOSBA|nr:hypothetical protein ES319_1Z212600v1 [Gossypium barbadense]TYH30132.1 hypothetical protein ES288_A01G069400v1 [Gossypium darwinii]
MERGNGGGDVGGGRWAAFCLELGCHTDNFGLVQALNGRDGVVQHIALFHELKMLLRRDWVVHVRRVHQGTNSVS